MKLITTLITTAVLSTSVFAQDAVKKPGPPNIPPKPEVAKKADDKKPAAKPVAPAKKDEKKPAEKK
jgi:hypothetical protein